MTWVSWTIHQPLKCVLVGGLEHGFYDFPFSWECHHPNWRTHSIIFQRGRLKPRSNVLFSCFVSPKKMVILQVKLQAPEDGHGDHGTSRSTRGKLRRHRGSLPGAARWSTCCAIRGDWPWMTTTLGGTERHRGIHRGMMSEKPWESYPALVICYIAIENTP